MIKLGYKASAEQFAPGALLGFACLAEEVGFDSVFISDHFQPWKHIDGHAPFSLTWLGALGANARPSGMATTSTCLPSKAISAGAPQLTAEPFDPAAVRVPYTDEATSPAEVDEAELAKPAPAARTADLRLLFSGWKQRLGG